MKTKRLLQKLSLTIVCIEMSIMCLAQKKEPILANKTFIIEVLEKNLDGTEHKLQSDEIKFKAGKVGATFSARNGFTAALYTITVDSATNTNKITFTASSTNGERNTLKWTGTINDDTMEGKASRTRTKKSGCDYLFTGTLKK